MRPVEQAVSASIQEPVPPSITTPSNSTAAGTDFPVIVQSAPSRYSPAKSLTVVASLTVKAANVGIRAGRALHGRQRVDSVRKGTFQCCMVTLLGGRCRGAMESVDAHTTSPVIGGIPSSNPSPRQAMASIPSIAQRAGTAHHHHQQSGQRRQPPRGLRRLAKGGDEQPIAGGHQRERRAHANEARPAAQQRGLGKRRQPAGLWLRCWTHLLGDSHSGFMQ